MIQTQFSLQLPPTVEAQTAFELKAHEHMSDGTVLLFIYLAK